MDAAAKKEIGLYFAKCPGDLVQLTLPGIELARDQRRQRRELLEMSSQRLTGERLQCYAGGKRDEVKYQQLGGETLGRRNSQLAASPGRQADLRLAGHGGALDIRNRDGAVAAAIRFAQCRQRIGRLTGL